MVLNGDTYLDINFDHIYAEFIKVNSIYIPLIKTDKQSFKLNSIAIDKNGRAKFSSNSKFMNSGMYFLKKKTFKNFLKLKSVRLRTIF